MKFRTLAKKSTLNFGKLFDLTVQQVLTFNKHHYLIWVYYNCSHISFNAEILEILDITKERQIKKPGVNRNYYDEHKGSFMPLYDKNQQKLSGRTRRLEVINKRASLQAVSDKLNNRTRLMRINQGHYRGKAPKLF